MLSVMALNFAFETAIVVGPTCSKLRIKIANRMSQTFAKPQTCCSSRSEPDPDHAANLKTSCCSEKMASIDLQYQSCCADKTVIAKPSRKHSCRCCGESCLMGDSCTCGLPQPAPGGLFMRAPSCHPSQDAAGTGFVPPSLRFEYLNTALSAPTNTYVACAKLISPAVLYNSFIALPATPPPRRAAALTA
jgi:hypothetical protein